MPLWLLFLCDAYPLFPTILLHSSSLFSCLFMIWYQLSKDWGEGFQIHVFGTSFSLAMGITTFNGWSTDLSIVYDGVPDLDQEWCVPSNQTQELRSKFAPWQPRVYLWCIWFLLYSHSAHLAFSHNEVKYIAQKVESINENCLILFKLTSHFYLQLLLLFVLVTSKASS